MAKYSVGLGMASGAALGILCSTLILPALNLAIAIGIGASCGLLIGAVASHNSSTKTKKESSRS
ncbi:MAG: hypothetical protein MUO60_20580 [Clostridiaceae bacterium]|nr:hypothetical protein [Clostridiaceae bacterium]